MPEPTKKHHWDPEQRRLLQECIDGKWEDQVQHPDWPEPDCVLCDEYDNDPRMDDDDRCKGCPVAEYSGQKFCDGTPYRTWNRRKYGPKPFPTETELRDLATAERDFLREVLEAG